MTKNVCIVGLGYVGLTLGVYLARNGMNVHGVEIANNILTSLSQKKSHFYEKDFDDEIKLAIESGNFSFGQDYKKVDGRLYYILTIGTLLGQDGRVNLNALNTVSQNLSEIIKDDDVVILRSTVKVGTTRDVVKPILDASGKKYHLGFCPERTLEGVAFEELSTLPQIVSGINDSSVAAINELFEPVSRKLVHLPNVEEAEMVKLLNNSERDLMFALANEIALMSDAKGLDAYRIIEAANFEYKRSNLKKPGPVGGPCLEKDPYILTEGFKDDSYVPILFTTGRKVNEAIVESGLDLFFARYLDKNENQPPIKVAILGFAFKGMPPTGDVRGSLVCDVTTKIKNQFPYCQIHGHDYLATHKDIRHVGANIASNDIEETISGADLVVIQNNHPGYAEEDWQKLRSLMSSNSMIYDFWNQLTPKDGIEIASYFSLGSFS
tara:strand:+ start:1728 stop:3038 length:1311 start_codon:yes stop_codon:yes gene_type:complete